MSSSLPSPPPAPSSSSKLTLHFLDHSRAETILWILEELQVEYEMKVYSRGSNYLAPKELREIHPLGKSPVIVHNSLVIAETGNIISYLLRTFDSHTNGVFSPKDLSPEMDQKNAYYLHYAEGSLMPILVNKLVFSKFPEMSPWYARPIITGFAAQVNKNWLDMELKKHLGMIDGDLQKTGSSSSWFCGGEEPTQADFVSDASPFPPFLATFVSLTYTPLSLSPNSSPR
ncbi:hypothetical protein BDY24DRAFT_342648 [Mrakia frigida]|uniref:bifunctional glutathione transferase/peroxidase n=1 Tax=Mrakia frigida TaxID=29902 RepID=UPI003FCC1249